MYHTENYSIIIVCLLLVGCAESASLDAPRSTSQQSSSNPSTDYRLAPPGKADGYYSNEADEYKFSGTLKGVKISPSDFENAARRKEIISREVNAVAVYLTSFMRRKLPEWTGGSDNTDWGDGFNAMVRHMSAQKEALTAVNNNTYRLHFSIEVAGPQNLAKRIAESEYGSRSSTGDVSFEFQMPSDPNVDFRSMKASAASRFSPDNYDGRLQNIQIAVERFPEMPNSYPRYRSFFEDGVYDLTVFFGYNNYGNLRWDQQAAQSLFETLSEWSDNAPAASFDQLRGDSGPFTGRMKVFDGNERRWVDVEIRMYHPKMEKFRQGETRQSTLRHELKKRDVIIYQGHGGPYFGLMLDDSPTGLIEYSDFKDFDLSEKQQLFFAQGCQTYSQYADMFYANPAKDEANLDVITTVNYGSAWANGSIEFLKSLLRTTENGYHDPVAYKELIGELNDEIVNQLFSSLYGVTGIGDENRQVHPQANLDAIGRSCRTTSQCGSTQGNMCLEGECMATVLRDGDGCPEGTEKAAVVSSQSIVSGEIEGTVCHD